MNPDSTLSRPLNCPNDPDHFSGLAGLLEILQVPLHRVRLESADVTSEPEHS
jgi:hypothetical protein